MSITLPSFDLSTTHRALHYKSPGVKKSVAAERRPAEICRSTPLSKPAEYDFRSPDVLVNGQDIPRVTPSSLAQQIRTSRLVDKNEARDLLKESFRPKQPRLYFGPGATGEYKSPAISPAPRDLCCVSPGSMQCKNYKLRERVEVRYEHTGVWQADIDGIESWSCCGAEMKGAQGCNRKVKHVGRAF